MKNNSKQKPTGLIIDNELMETWADFLTCRMINPGRPLYYAELINTEALNYSLASLNQIDSYLEFVRRVPPPQEEYHKILCRCGAYLGEVIRRSSPAESCRWIGYEAAVRLDPKIRKVPQWPGHFSCLYHVNGTNSFPFGKIIKRIQYGANESVSAFAELTILVNNLSKSQSDDFFKEVEANANGQEAVSIAIVRTQ